MIWWNLNDYICWYSNLFANGWLKELPVLMKVWPESYSTLYDFCFVGLLFRYMQYACMVYTTYHNFIFPRLIFLCTYKVICVSVFGQLKFRQGNTRPVFRIIHIVFVLSSTFFWCLQCSNCSRWMYQLASEVVSKNIWDSDFSKKFWLILCWVGFS